MNYQFPSSSGLRLYLWGLGGLLLLAAVSMGFYIRLQHVENQTLKTQLREAVALSRASDQATLYATQKKAATTRESASARARVVAAEASSPESKAWADQEVPEDVAAALE